MSSDLPSAAGQSGGEDDAPASSVVTDNPGAPVDDGAPIGPSEGEEAAFVAEQREQGLSAPTAPSRSIAAEAEPDAKAALPSLDELVQRVPSGVRQLMDELFRANFVTVKRVPKSALKN